MVEQPRENGLEALSFWLLLDIIPIFVKLSIDVFLKRLFVLTHGNLLSAPCLTSTIFCHGLLNDVELFSIKYIHDVSPL